MVYDYAMKYPENFVIDDDFPRMLNPMMDIDGQTELFYMGKIFGISVLPFNHF